MKKLDSDPNEGSTTFIKSLITTQLVLIASVWLNPTQNWKYFIQSLTNEPTNSIGRFEVWRLLTSPLVQISFLNWFCSVWCYYPLGVAYERGIGASKMFKDFVIKNLEINLLYCAIHYVALWLFSININYAVYGLTGILFVQATANAYNNPRGIMRFLSLPIHIPFRYSPIVLLLFFCLVQRAIIFEALIGIAVGIIHAKYLDSLFMTIEYSGYSPMKSPWADRGFNFDEEQSQGRESVISDEESQLFAHSLNVGSDQYYKKSNKKEDLYSKQNEYEDDYEDSPATKGLADHAK